MTINSISPQQADRLIKAEGYAYLDVRSIPEFEAGHPAGAYNIPLMHMSPAGMQPNPEFITIVEATFSKETKLVIGCKMGGRSKRAALLLNNAGYINLVDQGAGFAGTPDAPGWQACGLDVATQAEDGRSYAELEEKAKI